MKTEIKNIKIEDEIISFLIGAGCFFLLISFILLFIGIISPSSCGSGNCLLSIPFHFLWLLLSVIGLVFIIVGLLEEQRE